MTAPLIHLKPKKKFHNPLVCNLDRFIEDPSRKRNLMSFSHGSRQYLGIQLAYAELYLMLASLWRRFGCREDKGDEGWLELYQTDKTDVEMVADRFVPYPKKESKGIRIVVWKWEGTLDCEISAEMASEAKLYVSLCYIERVWFGEKSGRPKLIAEKVSPVLLP